MIRLSMLSMTLVSALAIPTFAQTTAPEKETGLAAVYSEVLNGRRTASGQVYDQTQLTAAHKTLPFGTVVRVTNVNNNRSVTLRVNDRGPRQAERVLDISPAAAVQLGFSRFVMREVTVEVLKLGTGRTTRQPTTDRGRD